MNASWTRLICGMVLLPILACQQDRYQARPIGFVVGDTTLCAPPTTQNRRYTEADLRAAPRFRLDSAGQLTIGDREGGEEYDLSRVRRIAMASPTVALLSTSAPASVLWADASTDEIHVVASGGEGPGQVRDVGGIVVRGTDSIGIFDPINARISWFGSNRRLLGSTSLLAPTGVPLLFSTAVALAGMLPGSRLAVSDVQILSGSRGGGNAERWRSMARLDVVTLVEGPSIAAVSRSLQLPNHDMAMHSLSTPDGAVRSPFPVRFSRSAFAGVVGKRLVLSAPEGDGFVFCRVIAGWTPVQGDSTRQGRAPRVDQGTTVRDDAPALLPGDCDGRGPLGHRGPCTNRPDLVRDRIGSGRRLARAARRSAGHAPVHHDGAARGLP